MARAHGPGRAEGVGNPRPLDDGMSRLLPVNIATKAIALVLAALPLLAPDRPGYRRKAMRARAVVYPLVPMAIPVTWRRRGRPAPYPHAIDIALALPLILDAGANASDLYGRIRNLDLVVHLVNTGLVVAAVGAGLSPLMPNRWSAAVLATSLGISGEALWEIAEYLAQRSGATGMDLSYDNTTHDLISSSVGAAIGGLATAGLLWPRRGEVGALFGWRLVQRPRPTA